MIFLHESIETGFATNGIGPLPETLSCKVRRQVNGDQVLDMVYPFTGARYADLREDRIIRASVGPDEPMQPFRISEIDDTSISGKVLIYAEHVAYDLQGVPVIPFSSESLPDVLTQLQGGAAAIPHQFTFSTNKTSNLGCSIPTPRAMWDMLGGSEGSLLDVYKGEWCWDRFHLRLLDRLGADLGATVRYGVNLTTLEQEKRCANVWTGVCPYWYDGTNPPVMLPERIVYADGKYARQRVLVLDLSAEFDTAPAEDELRQRTIRYMADNNIGKPTVGLTVQFVELARTEEFKDHPQLQRVHLGDTVRVEFPKMGVDTSSRVVETEWDALLDTYISIRLGSVRANFADIVAATQSATNARIAALSARQNGQTAAMAAVMGLR